MFSSILLASLTHLSPISPPQAPAQVTTIERKRRSGGRRHAGPRSEGVPFAGDGEASEPEPTPSRSKTKKSLGRVNQKPRTPKAPKSPECPTGTTPNEKPQTLGGPRGALKPNTAGGGRTPVEPTGEPLGEPHGGLISHGEPTLPVAPAPLTVVPAEGLDSSGPLGGPFSPQDADYLLTNDGASPLTYSVSVDAAFVQLSKESGSLAPGASTELTVTIDPSLSAALPIGNYAATVEISDLTSGLIAERDVTLSIHAAGPQGLIMTPAAGLTSTGAEGGPFAPGSRSFQLRNSSSQSMAFQASADMGWISLSQTSGQIPAGQALSLTASIDAAQVAGYQPGTYNGQITVADLTGGTSEERDVKLIITAASAGTMVTQLSQFGITWYFDRAHQAGQFANGDYWVVGPVTIIDIDPSSENVFGRIANGSMINPSPRDGTRQGYDNSMYAQYKQPGDFDNSMNVAYEVSPAKPLNVTPHSSLVSTISEVEANLRPQIRTCAILTVLPKAALPGDFRPAYCGKNKSIQFNEGQLDYSLLERLPIPASASAITRKSVSLEATERMFERAWLDHVPLWIGRYTHPSQNMPDYGREIVDHVSVAAMMLHLDLDPSLSTADLNAMKRDLLVRFVQLGIDFYGIAMDGGTGNWRAAAGHMSGRKWPILFAGLMLSDPDMSEIGLTKQIQFGEDEQTFVVSEDAEGVINQGYGNYTTQDLGKPEWGTNHPMQPWFDDSDWFGDPYRLCCTANAWWGQLLAAHIMGATDDWNHDVLFDYQDRFLDENELQGVEDWRLAWRGWYLELWKTYRPQF